MKSPDFLRWKYLLLAVSPRAKERALKHFPPEYVRIGFSGDKAFREKIVEGMTVHDVPHLSDFNERTKCVDSAVSVEFK